MKGRWIMAGYEYDDEGRLVIDVTKPARFEPTGPRIDVTQPVVRGLTLDGRRPGDFRNYEQANPRAPGDFTERIVATDQGVQRIQGADRRLSGMGADGLQIIQPGTGRSDRLIENDAAGISGDGNIVLSQGAISALGQRQIQEEMAAKAIEQRQDLIGGIAQTSPIIRSLQTQADQGFVPEGTDARNRGIMRQSEARNARLILERSRPKDIMSRLNTADQIMTQADASRLTPQIQVQDGVASGWDPVQQKIVTDSSGARALGASRVKDTSLDGEDDRTLLDQYTKMQERKSGKLSGDNALMYTGMLKRDPKMAESYKSALIGTWSSDDDQMFGQVRSRLLKRGLLQDDGVTAPVASGAKAPAAGSAKAPVAGKKTSQWALK